MSDSPQDYIHLYLEGIPVAISQTTGLNQYTVNPDARNRLAAKYGIFIRTVAISLFRQNLSLARLDMEDLVGGFMAEKFALAIESHGSEKGNFRAYLRTMFRNYVIDYWRAQKKVKEYSYQNEDLPESSSKEIEELLETTYDVEYFRPVFHELDNQIDTMPEMHALFIYYKKLARKGSWKFSTEDFRDIDQFYALLAEQESPLTQYLYDNLSSDTQQLLKDYLAQGSRKKTLHRHFITELNRLLRDDSLYDSQRFASVPLSSEMKKLLATPEKPQNLLRLHRLLLEKSYSEHIFPHSLLEEEEGEENEEELSPSRRKKAQKNLLEVASQTARKHFYREQDGEFLEYFLSLYLKEKFNLL